MLTSGLLQLTKWLLGSKRFFFNFYQKSLESSGLDTKRSVNQATQVNALTRFNLLQLINQVHMIPVHDDCIIIILERENLPNYDGIQERVIGFQPNNLLAMQSSGLTVPKVEGLKERLEVELDSTYDHNYTRGYITDDQLVSFLPNEDDTFGVQHALLSVHFIAQHMENLDNYYEVGNFVKQSEVTSVSLLF